MQTPLGNDTFERVCVTAQTATSNPFSGRVLDKAGFIPTGKGWSPDDGDLITWQLRHPPTPRS